MSEETLNILNELSKIETTDLALNIMELTADNMVKDEEIERLTISLQAQEELTMTWYNKVKNARDLFYEKCRISQNGIYTFNEVDYEELSNILGSDKE